MLELLDGEGSPVGEYRNSPARVAWPPPGCTRPWSTGCCCPTAGSSALARHVANAALKEDSQGVRLAKEHRNSRRRIDAAVAAVVAHERAAVLAGDCGPSISV